MSRLEVNGIGSCPVVGFSTVMWSLCKFCYHNVNLVRMWICVRACVCVCVCARARACACVRACVRERERASARFCMLLQCYSTFVSVALFLDTQKSPFVSG
jgi:hypothetical protein